MVDKTGENGISEDFKVIASSNIAGNVSRLRIEPKNRRRHKGQSEVQLLCISIGLASGAELRLP